MNNEPEQPGQEIEDDAPPRRRIRLFGKTYTLPESLLLRRVVGVGLILGGILGFLPVLGFWMIPLGVLVLSQDSHLVRRWRRRTTVKVANHRLARRFRNGSNGTGDAGAPD